LVGSGIVSAAAKESKMRALTVLGNVRGIRLERREPARHDPERIGVRLILAMDTVQPSYLSVWVPEELFNRLPELLNGVTDVLWEGQELTTGLFANETMPQLLPPLPYAPAMKTIAGAEAAEPPPPAKKALYADFGYVMTAEDLRRHQEEAERACAEEPAEDERPPGISPVANADGRTKRRRAA
jgi:hypothetical protein